MANQHKKVLDSSKVYEFNEENVILQVIFVEDSDPITYDIKENIYIPLKQICNFLGINYRRVYKLIRRDKNFSPYLLNIRICSAKGIQYASCLDSVSLQNWFEEKFLTPHQIVKLAPKLEAIHRNVYTSIYSEGYSDEEKVNFCAITPEEENDFKAYCLKSAIDLLPKILIDKSVDPIFKAKLSLYIYKKCFERKIDALPCSTSDGISAADFVVGSFSKPLLTSIYPYYQYTDNDMDKMLNILNIWSYLDPFRPPYINKRELDNESRLG